MDTKLEKVVAKLSAKWGRQLEPYLNDDVAPIYCVYGDGALTGFIAIVTEIETGEFKGQKSILLPLSNWVMLTTLGDRTVTPFRVVAAGKKDIKAAAWMPHTGLKYAVRHEKRGACIHIPVSDFKAV